MNMITDRDATHYRMDHNNRGKALIFNHEHFRYGIPRQRHGTHADAVELEKQLKRIGFYVCLYKDSELHELKTIISQGTYVNYYLRFAVGIYLKMFYTKRHLNVLVGIAI